MLRVRVLLTLLGLVTPIVLVVLASPSSARADQGAAHSLSVAVLTFDSDDAEDQADALTGALRSRIRTSQGWSLVETTQSLGMLTVGLRCPAKPLPADCEQKIAEQIHSDRFIFGYVQRGPTGQVTAEVHLYQKNKQDAIARDSYSDNLKDANDETLRKIAQRLLDCLGGAAVGTIVVRMGTENGEVVVDGDKRVPLQSGTARLELAPGTHSVEVVSGEGASGPQKRNVLVSAGKETVLDLSLAGSGPEPRGEGGKPFPIMKVVGGAVAVVGVGLGIFAVERALEYGSMKDDFENDPAYGPDKFVSTNGQSVSACEAKLASDPTQTSATACKRSDEAKSVSTTGIVTGAASAVLIATGAVLFFKGDDWLSKSPSSSSAKRAPKPRIVPTFGYGTGGMMVSGSF